MNEQTAFLNALIENEDDTTTRLVYADWLEERGEHEEADRQRRWPAAKEWLVTFCRKVNSEDEIPDGEDLINDEFDDNNPWSYFGISYEKLVALGRMAVEESNETGIGLFCGANMSLMEALQANSREFWENWSVVTGILLPPDAAEKSSFSCAC
jgi:uncharacterized protein (TIGR02996 family)